MTQTRSKTAAGDFVAGANDPLWDRLRLEAETVAQAEPALTRFILGSILHQPSLEATVIHRLASRLGHAALPADSLERIFVEALDKDKAIGTALRTDIAAVLDRDPATSRIIEPVLYYKGFHAIQTYRVTHWLWTNGRQDLALYLQSRSSEVFQTDIHPNARIGHGIFLDHATGLVVGSTAVIEHSVSMLHNVTIGDTGKITGRHPKIRHGVFIGAGAKIVGDIEVGHCARIAAGSLVLKSVPANATLAGVPAGIVGSVTCAKPIRSMDHVLADVGV